MNDRSSLYYKLAYIESEISIPVEIEHPLCRQQSEERKSIIKSRKSLTLKGKSVAFQGINLTESKHLQDDILFEINVGDKQVTEKYYSLVNVQIQGSLRKSKNCQELQANNRVSGRTFPCISSFHT